MIIIFGAFFEAFIMGSLAAEMQKISDKEMTLTKMLEYIKFSLHNSKVPMVVQNKVKRYLN